MNSSTNRQSVLLGFCPIGKFVFSHENALVYKKKLEELLTKWNIRFIGIDEVVPDGMIRGIEDVSKAVKFLKAKGIDGVFMPHCNFGTEHAVGLLGRDLEVPVLVWAPRDEAPLADGTRLRDSLCGLFASTKVLRKLHVPFTYIENCRVDEKPLKDGIDTFLKAINVAKTLKKGIRVAHIGQRIDFFWTTIINESELLQKFKVEVLPIDMVEFLARVTTKVAKERSRYNDEIKKVKETFSIEGFKDDMPLINMLALRDQMLEVVETHSLDGIALQSFMSIVDSLGGYTGLASAYAANSIPIGMESDIHGAISNIILEKVSFHDTPAYLADITTRHPENDNGVLIWHSDAPLSLCHPDVKPKLGHHWILPSPLSGMSHFRLKDGLLTVARFDGEDGEYQLVVGEGKTFEGPYNQNNYLWMEVKDWLKWERTLMEGPFIHHAGITYGHHSKALIEACKYIPGLEPLSLD